MTLQIIDLIFCRYEHISVGFQSEGKHVGKPL